jgi:protein SCO1/2
MKKILVAMMILSGFIFMVFTSYLFIKETRNIPLPVLGQLKPFELTDSRGQTFDSQQLSGSVWVANFFFTTCGTICPVMAKNMAALQRSFALEDNVYFVSISVNPENDTPQRLQEFSQRYQADSNKWFFLTGGREAITRLAVDQFKVGSVDEPIFHSASFILVDRDGRIRGYYDGTQPNELQRLFKHLAQLFRDKTGQ